MKQAPGIGAAEGLNHNSTLYCVALNVKQYGSKKEFKQNLGAIRVQQDFPRIPWSATGGDRRREITTSYLWTLDCHGRGREFESRRPRHFLTANTLGAPNPSV